MAGVSRQYEGFCHCRSLSYRYQTALPPQQWTVRACQCSFCRLHAALTTSDPAGSLSFIAADPVCLQRYQFGERTVDFLICRRCGSYLGASLGAGTDATAVRYGLINLRALQGMSLELAEPVMMNYDGESTASRRARRKARWTPLARASL